LAVTQGASFFEKLLSERTRPSRRCRWLSQTQRLLSRRLHVDAHGSGPDQVCIYSYRMSIYINIFMDVKMYIRIYICIYIGIYIGICICDICIYICVYTYTHIYICIYTYM